MMQLLKIGDFSKLSQVGVKTLRYYDDIGLLKPAEVDRFTGYRYYAFEQLARLNRIVALKELGFSLEQVAELLDDDIPVEQLQGMLRLRRAEIERQIAGEQERLRRVQARLEQLARPDYTAAYDVVTRPVEPLAVALIRRRIPAYDQAGDLLNPLYGYLGAQRIEPAGPPLLLYHDGDYREEDPDVEACVPVETVGRDDDELRFATLPGVLAVTTLHHGPYETLSLAYGAVLNWIALNDYETVPPSREIFLRGPGPGEKPADYLTEIQFPVQHDMAEHSD